MITSRISSAICHRDSFRYYHTYSMVVRFDTFMYVNLDPEPLPIIPCSVIKTGSYIMVSRSRNRARISNEETVIEIKKNKDGDGDDGWLLGCRPSWKIISMRQDVPRFYLSWCRQLVRVSKRIGLREPERRNSLATLYQLGPALRVRYFGTPSL